MKDKRIEITIDKENNITVNAENVSIGTGEIVYYLEMAKLKILYTNGHLFDILNK